MYGSTYKMKKFTTLTSKAFPIRIENIDTDQIIPARFLKTIKQEGLGQYLFFNWRYDEHDHQLDRSVFSNSPYKDARILITGNNFGCGSSREHAPWAILDYGFEAIISSSFGDIFYNNSLANGLLPVIVTHSELNRLFALVEEYPKTKITIDLPRQHVKVSSFSFSFPIDAFRKMYLLNGTDELGFILSQEKKIKEYETSHL